MDALEEEEPCLPFEAEDDIDAHAILFSRAKQVVVPV